MIGGEEWDAGKLILSPSPSQVTIYVSVVSVDVPAFIDNCADARNRLYNDRYKRTGQCCRSSCDGTVLNIVYMLNLLQVSLTEESALVLRGP